MATNQTILMNDNNDNNDNENDSIIPQGNCQWTASTGFRPPSDCFAPYIIRTARRASFPPSNGVKKYDIRAFNHRRPASRNLLNEIYESSYNTTETENKKINDDKINPPKRIKVNDKFNDKFNDLQIKSAN
jgi:hypothetical protein